MAKKNVRDAPSKTQVTENPQMSDIVLVLDKMELLIQAVSEINRTASIPPCRQTKSIRTPFSRLTAMRPSSRTSSRTSGVS